MEVITATLALVVVVLFGVWAAYLYYTSKAGADLEFFLTARNTQPWTRVGWGLFVASCGSGVLFGPASFILFGGGYIGLITYSLFAGLPLILIAYLGNAIRARVPSPMSISSFAKWRYGSAMEILVTLNVLFNLGIALSVEYTAVGALFSTFLSLPSWVPILVIGLVTMVYTCLGGLYISIITDQFQAYFVISLIVCVLINLIAVNFPGSNLPPLPSALGATEIGYGSIATLGLALTSSAVFSDALWQRVWSAKSQKALNHGAYLGSIVTILVTFFFGFCGLIAGWSGLVNLDNPDEINAAFFAILKPSNSVALFTVVVLIAVVLSEAAVDSFQNAILSSIISLCLSFGFKVPVWAARTLVVVFNVPLMIIGTQGFPIVSLYLITNMLTTCCFIPLIIGLYKRFDNIVNQGTVLFGCAFALVSVLVLGTIVYGSFASGVQQYFFSPNYQWSAFVCAPVSSVVGMALYAFVETKILRKRTASPPMELPSNE